MHTGMLWFNNDKKLSLVQKLVGAIAYFIKKYERTPDLVLVHPSMVENETLETDEKTGKVKVHLHDEKDLPCKDVFVTIRPYRPVLPGHLWIGIEDTSAAAEEDKTEDTE